jgi:uncharacterized protein (TIGR00290 family)
VRRFDLRGVPFVCSWSGGKDSCLALHRAVAAGGVLVKLLCLVREDGTASLGHSLPVEVIEAQAERLGCALETCPTSWHDYEPMWTAALHRQRDDGIDAVVFGDLHIAYHRRWERDACTGSGLRPVWPLWKERTSRIADELLSGSTRAVIACLRADPLDAGLLGRELDAPLLREIGDAGADPFGENGEYHTVVVDAPLFSQPVEIRPIGRYLDGGFWHLDFGLVPPGGAGALRPAGGGIPRPTRV